MVQSATACSRPATPRHRCGRSSTWPARSTPTAASIRTSGSTATPYWQGLQLDEVAFPIMLAWRLHRGTAPFGTSTRYPMVLRARRLPDARGPSDAAGALGGEQRLLALDARGQHRRAGLRGRLLRAARTTSATAQYIEEYADFLESHVERWTVTTEGDAAARRSAGTTSASIPSMPATPSPTRIRTTGVARASRNRPPGAHVSHSRRKTSSMPAFSSWCATASARPAIRSSTTRCA